MTVGKLRPTVPFPKCIRYDVVSGFNESMISQACNRREKLRCFVEKYDTFHDVEYFLQKKMDLQEEIGLTAMMAAAADMSASIASDLQENMAVALSLLESSLDDEQMTCDEFFDDFSLRFFYDSDELPDEQYVPRGQKVDRQYQEGHNILVRQYFADYPELLRQAVPSAWFGCW